MKARYLESFKTLNATAFEPGRVSKVIAACEAAVKEPVARETKANPRPGGFGFGPPGGFGGGQMTPTDFVTARVKSVAAQLAGQKTGFVPRAFGMGPPPIKQPDPAKCVDACKACAATCEACAKQASEPKHEACAKLCVSCSRACLLCAELSLSKSLLAADACVLCEKLCLECAATCVRFDGAHFKECEKSCRECVKACFDARR